jgi:DNA methylase
MLEDALLDVTNRADIVLDPFLGSGSTLIAAEKTGRVCRGVELDPLYVDVIIRRFEAVTGETAVLIETGEAFAALAVRRASLEESAADSGLEDIGGTGLRAQPSNDNYDDTASTPVQHDRRTVDDDEIDTGEVANCHIRSPSKMAASEAVLAPAAGVGNAAPEASLRPAEAYRNVGDAEKVVLATVEREDNGLIAVNDNAPAIDAPLEAFSRPGSAGVSTTVEPSADKIDTAETNEISAVREFEVDDAPEATHHTNDSAGEAAPAGIDRSPDSVTGPHTFLEADASDDHDTEQDSYVAALGLSLGLTAGSTTRTGQGVSVTHVDRAGAAAEEGLRAGNLILEVAGKAVSRPAQVIAAIATATHAGRATIMMRIKTANTTRLVQFGVGRS